MEVVPTPQKANRHIIIIVVVIVIIIVIIIVRSCGVVVRVIGYRSRGPDSISGATRFSEK
jgi:hypothetical protein